ncbi:helix-turn-helix domain-containing protein [Candidatus Harpocratesius sp.]
MDVSPNSHHDLSTLLNLLALKGQKAKLFSEILRHPGMSASRLGELTCIPQNKVYQLLEDLYAGELVMITETHPKQYWPCDLNGVLEEKKTFLNKKVSEFDTMQMKIADLMQTLQFEAEEMDQRKHPPFITSYDLVVGSPSRIFQELNTYLIQARKTLHFLGDWNLYEVGVREGVTNTIEQLLVNHPIQISQIIVFPEALLMDLPWQQIQFIQSRDGKMKNRTNYYMINRSALRYGFIIIDSLIIGFFFENPLLQTFCLGLFLESRHICSEFLKMFKTTHRKAHKSFQEMLQYHPELVKKSI